MNSPKEQDCVLLTLTKDNKIERVRHCTHSDDELRDYFDAIIAKFKNDFYAMKDIWVLKMVFTDKSRIPDIAIMDQYETLQKLLRNPQLYGIKEHKAFLVHDLDFAAFMVSTRYPTRVRTKNSEKDWCLCVYGRFPGNTHRPRRACFHFR